jgi:hypothetical protein
MFCAQAAVSLGTHRVFFSNNYIDVNEIVRYVHICNGDAFCRYTDAVFEGVVESVVVKKVRHDVDEHLMVVMLNYFAAPRMYVVLLKHGSWLLIETRLLIRARLLIRYRLLIFRLRDVDNDFLNKGRVSL